MQFRIFLPVENQQKSLLEVSRGENRYNKTSVWGFTWRANCLLVGKLFVQRIKEEIHAVFGDVENNFGDFQQLHNHLSISRKRRKKEDFLRGCTRYFINFSPRLLQKSLSI